MADKIAQGVIWEQPASATATQGWLDDEKQRLTKKRDDARWFVIVGVGLMFAGGVSAGFAVGGALMCVYGIATSIIWGRRLTALDDPWDDADIDAWEEENFG